jgi:hypothetical protein
MAVTSRSASRVRLDGQLQVLPSFIDGPAVGGVGVRVGRVVRAAEVGCLAHGAFEEVEGAGAVVAAYLGGGLGLEVRSVAPLGGCFYSRYRGGEAMAGQISRSGAGPRVEE